MTDTPTPPDGWYPDPAGGGGLRRWNGTSWTDEVRSATGEQVAPSEPRQDAVVSDAGAGAGAAHDSAGVHDSDVAHDSAAAHDVAGTDHAAADHAPQHGIADALQTDPSHDATSTGSASGHEAPGHDAAASLTASEPVGHESQDSATSSTTEGGHTGVGSTGGGSIPPVTPPGAGVPPVTPPAAPVAPPAAPAYTSAPAFPSAPSSPSAPAYAGAGGAAVGSAYGATPAYPSAPPVAYDTTPRRDITTNTVWVWLLVFLPLLSLLGVVMFDWTSYIRDSFYAGVYSYDSGDTAMAGTSAAGTLLTVVSSVVSLVISALTVLFAFLDWRQLRARGVERPFHWAWSFFVLVVGSGLVYIIGRGVILRRRTGSGLAPIWASIAVNVVVLIGFVIWVVVLIAQLSALISEFSSSYGY